MATDVIMPQMGESIAEGTITKWLKKVGETVKRDEPIFEISTDKVDAEIPSPVAGTLLEIKVPEGQTVAINTVVASIGEAAEQPAASASAKLRRTCPRCRQPRRRNPRLPRRRLRLPSRLRKRPPKNRRRSPRPPLPPRSRRLPQPPRQRVPSEASAKEGGRIESIEERIRRRSSPLVRKIASEHAVDITQLEGTGIHSRVTKNDILSYIENRKVAAAPASARTAAGGRRRPSKSAERSRKRRRPRVRRCA